MSSKHSWTEDDDIIALYLYKFKGEENIPNSYEDIANFRGFTVNSLKSAFANFKAIDTGKGLLHYAKHQKSAYEKYKDMPKTELRRLVIDILSRKKMSQGSD